MFLAWFYNFKLCGSTCIEKSPGKAGFPRLYVMIFLFSERYFGNVLYDNSIDAWRTDSNKTRLGRISKIYISF